MKKGFLISVSLLLAAVVAFGQNTSTVNQQNGVTMSKVKVEQIGDLNSSTVVQNAGTKNESSVKQYEYGDFSIKPFFLKALQNDCCMHMGILLKQLFNQIPVRVQLRRSCGSFWKGSFGIFKIFFNGDSGHTKMTGNLPV